MITTFFVETDKTADINIDLEHFTDLLAEFTGTYKKTKMIVRMKEIYRDRNLLIDFLDRIHIDLKYVIELTYHFEPRIITPQLKTELKELVNKWPDYPYYGSEISYEGSNG